MEDFNWTPVVIGACIVISILIYVFGTQYQIVSLQSQYPMMVKLNRTTGKTWWFCADAKNRWWEEMSTFAVADKEGEPNSDIRPIGP